MVLTAGRMPRRASMEQINTSNGLTPRVEQLKKRLLDARTVVAAERAWYYLESYKQTEGQHPSRRRAAAFRNVLEKMPIAIRDGELLVGAPTPHIRGAHPAVETDPFQLEIVLSQPEQSTSSRVQDSLLYPDDKERLLAACRYWKEKWPGSRAFRLMFSDSTRETVDRMNESRLTVVTAPFATPLAPGADYDRLLGEGMNSLIDEAKAEMQTILSKPPATLTEEDREKLANEEAMVIALEGMIAFARRHATLAREMAARETVSQRKKELEKIAEVCENVPANPARGFQEALQAAWFMLIGYDVEKAQPGAFIGRFDQYIWPYYEKDIAEGALTRQEAAELLGCIFVKWATLEPFLFLGLHGERAHQEVAQANYMACLTIGGLGTGGQDGANELSCLLLHVAKQVKTHQPGISLRWHRAMPSEIIDKALECARDHGGGIPAFHNDHVGIGYLLNRGFPTEDARDWAVAGCISPAYQKSFVFQRAGGPGFVNHAKLLELALNNGIDPSTGARLGPSTGDPGDFHNLDELVEAYRTQIDSFYRFWMELYAGVGPTMMEDAAYFPFISALNQGCIKAGKDCLRGGLRYDRLEAASFTDRAMQDAADSLAAIDNVVFEGGVSMATLLDALRANWEGYEELRQKCLAVPKYGNDDDRVDSLMFHLWKYTTEKALSYKDFRGRRPVVCRQGAAWSQYAGRTVGALPNGRKAGTALADASASPVQGADTNGPVAVIDSVTKLDTMYIEGPVLNMKLAPGPLRTREGRLKLFDFITSYMDKGGNHIQFNIIDTAALQDARVHPQKYADLVVCVAGYSALWVELTPEVQDEIISRTEHRL